MRTPHVLAATALALFAATACTTEVETTPAPAAADPTAFVLTYYTIPG